MPVRISSKLFGDWEKSKAILNNAAGVTRAINQAVLAEAHQARRDIVKGMTAQAPGGEQFLPLAPLTVLLRKAKGFRGTKALIVTGALRNSITVKNVGMGKAFVGVLRAAQSEDGRQLYNIARMNEFGTTFTVRVTARMRRWLMFQLRKLAKIQRGRDKKSGKYTKGKFVPTGGSGAMKRGLMVIRIPPRPFIQPVIRRIFENPAAVKARLTMRISANLKLTLGRP